MIGIHTVLWFSWFFWKMRWNYSGFCNCLSVFGPEIVEFVDYHEIHLKNQKKKSMQKQFVFIGPKVRGSQNRLFPCVIRRSENEKIGSEFRCKTLLFWEGAKISSQNPRNTYNCQKVILKKTRVENDVSESCQNRRNTYNWEATNSGRIRGPNFWPLSLIILIVLRNC